jgi:hypothetical protein
MQDNQKAALIACLLEVLGDGREGSDAERVWPASGHPHFDSAAWNPRGAAAYRLAGRIRLHRSRNVGRY